MSRVPAGLAGALLAAGCGGPAGGAGWNVTDARETLDRAAVAEIAGQRVTKAERTKSVAAGAATAAVSKCEYTLADGTLVTFLTKVADTDDLGAEAAKYQDEARAAGAEIPQPVAGVGNAAFWSNGNGTMPHLEVFVGQHRFAMVAMIRPVNDVPAPIDPDWAKATAIKLAQKAGV